MSVPPRPLTGRGALLPADSHGAVPRFSLGPGARSHRNPRSQAGAVISIRREAGAPHIADVRENTVRDHILAFPRIFSAEFDRVTHSQSKSVTENVANRASIKRNSLIVTVTLFWAVWRSLRVGTVLPITESPPFLLTNRVKCNYIFLYIHFHQLTAVCSVTLAVTVTVCVSTG